HPGPRVGLSRSCDTSFQSQGEDVRPRAGRRGQRQGDQVPGRVGGQLLVEQRRLQVQRAGGGVHQVGTQRDALAVVRVGQPRGQFQWYRRRRAVRVGQRGGEAHVGGVGRADDV